MASLIRTAPGDFWAASLEFAWSFLGVFLQLYNGTRNINYQPGLAILVFAILHLFVLLTLPLIAAVKNIRMGVSFSYRFVDYACPQGCHVQRPLRFGVWLMDPQPFNFGPIVAGWICFGFGFLMTSVGQDFWDAVERDRWLCGLNGSLSYPSSSMDSRMSLVRWRWSRQAEFSPAWNFAAVHLNRPSPSFAI